MGEGSCWGLPSGPRQTGSQDPLVDNQLGRCHFQRENQLSGEAMEQTQILVDVYHGAEGLFKIKFS